MSLHQIVLNSSSGDQALSRVAFVLHGTAHLTEALSIQAAGLAFVPGSSVVSTNLVQAYELTIGSQKQALSWGSGAPLGESGKTLVWRVPSEFHVGYSVFSTAYIDRGLRQVSGAPLRYAAARDQLALYPSVETEAARMQIEREIQGGYRVDQHPQVVFAPTALVGVFDSTPALGRLLSFINHAADKFQPLDIALLAIELSALFVPAVANGPRAPAVMEALIVGTVESVVMSHLRKMRWQGLATMGYRFMEGQSAVSVMGAESLGRQRQAIDEMTRRLAAGIFQGPLRWLEVYTAHELRLMRLELEAAELDMGS